MEHGYVVMEGGDAEGTHFVHRADCVVLPQDGREDLGAFESCGPALEAARARHGSVDGCALCCPDCHAMKGGAAG